MSYLDIIMKLIGPIAPIGETNTDNKRFDNLKELCDLVNLLVEKIDDVHYLNKGSSQYSVKRAADYASSFLTKTLGICE